MTEIDDKLREATFRILKAHEETPTLTEPELGELRRVVMDELGACRRLARLLHAELADLRRGMMVNQLWAAQIDDDDVVAQGSGGPDA